MHVIQGRQNIIICHEQQFMLAKGYGKLLMQQSLRTLQLLVKAVLGLFVALALPILPRSGKEVHAVMIYHMLIAACHCSCWSSLL